MKYHLIKALNSLVSGFADVRILPTSYLYKWQYSFEDSLGLESTNGYLQPNEYLKADNPRLLELKTAYKNFDPAVITPLLWSDDVIKEGDLLSFRSDNAYVYQRRSLNHSELAYAITTYYTMSASENEIFERITEDGKFGAKTFEVGGKLISRDLLDSAREVDFIKRNIIPSEGPLRVLDIGAGYGRLAHRLTEALGDDVKVFATDGFAVSTFLAEFYLDQRNSSARVIPLNQFESFIANNSIDVAVNIHSFSECTTDAINWWVERLSKNGVKHLVIVPNGEFKTGLGTCLTNDGRNMEDIFLRHGYHCALREFRYSDKLVRQYGIDPAQLTLFSLQ